EQDGESRGHLRRAGLRLGAEEGESCDSELEDPVGELGDEAGAVQTPEVSALEDGTQIGDEGHQISLRRSGFACIADDPGYIPDRRWTEWTPLRPEGIHGVRETGGTTHHDHIVCEA